MKLLFPVIFVIIGIIVVFTVIASTNGLLNFEIEDKDLSPSALCTKQGFEWNEEFRYCYYGMNIELCEVSGGKEVCAENGSPGAFLEEDVCKPVCEFQKETD